MCRNYSTTAEASSPAVSAILSQLDENRKEHLIHHATRSSNKGEKNYSTNERDVLDVFFALKLLRHYLLCQNFNQFKDYEAMKYVVSNRDLFGMISRWISIFIKCDFEIAYRKIQGNSNVGSLPHSVEKWGCLNDGNGTRFEVGSNELHPGTIDKTSLKVVRGVNIRTKYYIIPEGDLYGDTEDGLRFLGKRKCASKSREPCF